MPGPKSHTWVVCGAQPTTHPRSTHPRPSSRPYVMRAHTRHTRDMLGKGGQHPSHPHPHPTPPTVQPRPQELRHRRLHLRHPPLLTRLGRPHVTAAAAASVMRRGRRLWLLQRLRLRRLLLTLPC